jgi:ribosome-binding protein aMBF1 (putative translation factor)
MNDRGNIGARRPATAQERHELQGYCQQVERDLPELRRQATQTENELRASAMLEPTVSGQLRRAISESGMDHRELADRTGLSPKVLAEFLAGAAALDSAAIDKLAALLKQQLKPSG